MAIIDLPAAELPPVQTNLGEVELMGDDPGWHPPGEQQTPSPEGNPDTVPAHKDVIGNIKRLLTEKGVLPGCERCVPRIESLISGSAMWYGSTSRVGSIAAAATIVQERVSCPHPGVINEVPA